MRSSITSAEQERIFEEEKIRTKARLKASLTPRNIVIYLVLIAVVVSFAAIMGKINSSGNNGHLAGLDNEIRSNVILLSSVEDEDKQLLVDKGAIKIFVPNYFNEDILAESIEWHPENFSTINLRDRFDLFVDGVQIMKANGRAKQFSDPASKASRKLWNESLIAEISAIDEYRAVAIKVEAELDVDLKDLKDSGNMRLKSALE